MPHWCKISSSYLVPVPSYWTWTKTTSQKKVFFLVKSLWNWDYDNFSHRNAGVTKLSSHDFIYNIIWVNDCRYQTSALVKNFWFFGLYFRKFLLLNKESRCHHWVLHARVSLAMKFQLKLAILTFWTKFFQKKIFLVKNRKSEYQHCILHIWMSTRHQMSGLNDILIYGPNSSSSRREKNKWMDYSTFP